MNSELQILLIEDLAWDAVLIERELRKAGLCFPLKCVQTGEKFWQELLISSQVAQKGLAQARPSP
jgi:hypothetical protein